MSELYAHVAEIYELTGNASAPLGALLRRFEVMAPDTKVAFDNTIAATKENPPSASHFIVIFQGGLDTRIRWPACWGGTYTDVQWRAIRDAIGGLDAVMLYVAEHCLTTKGQPIPERWRRR